MKLKYFLHVLGLCVTMLSCNVYKKKMVRVQDGGFYVKNTPYNFIGANYWQGMNLGAPLSGDRQRLIRELDELQELGVTNLRILAASEADEEMRFCVKPALQIAPGVYNEDLWLGLDFLLSEMSKRNMKAVMVLGNFWTWSGGFPQYLKWAGAESIPYPQEESTWKEFTDYSKQFYSNDDAQLMMLNHIKKVITRKNTITGQFYNKDNTIMAWQLANEPRGYDEQDAFVKWIASTSEFIKKIDKFHLVCLGSEGNANSPEAGIDAYRDNNFDSIDYITMHIWAQNWGWFNPSQDEEVFNEALKKTDQYWREHVKIALELNKPIILEEFGIARDNSSYLPTETTKWRDLFFSYIFAKFEKSMASNGMVKGLNFWSYSGEGRPNRPGEYWRKNDNLLGDPPHERQGWYGVYNFDFKTLSLIEKYNNIIKAINR